MSDEAGTRYSSCMAILQLCISWQGETDETPGQEAASPWNARRDTAGSSIRDRGPELPWSAEVAIGWDNGLTGNVNASAIGSIQNQVVVITSNSYNDVYGAGLHLRFGAGYKYREDTEFRVTIHLPVARC